MAVELHQHRLTAAQRAVLDAWPAFEAAAGVKWATFDKVMQALRYGPTLADLTDEEALQLAALLRSGSARLHLPTLPAGAAIARGRA